MLRRRLALKVCGMVDEENIRQVGVLLPDFMGFIFVPRSQRFCGELLKPSMLQGLSDSICKVGVFEGETVEETVDVCSKFNLDAIQLHGPTSATMLKTLRHSVGRRRLFKAMSVTTKEDLMRLDQFDDLVDGYVLDNGLGGTGKSFDWRLLEHYKSPRPFLLAGGIGVEQIAGVLELLDSGIPVNGIDINSKVEVAPGLKDVAKVRLIVARMAHTV